VVLSEDILRQPEQMLRTLCMALGIPWDVGMLRWPEGPKPFDGVWAPWWYKTAHKSTGVQPQLHAHGPKVVFLRRLPHPLCRQQHPWWAARQTFPSLIGIFFFGFGIKKLKLFWTAAYH
jgi:hypothetical protein